MKHKPATDCLRGGGPTKDTCGCYHCTLAVCSVCTAYEGGLTTDCPGEPVPFKKQHEVYESNLDYTVEKGWHQSDTTMKSRSPQFEPDVAAEQRRDVDRKVRKLCDVSAQLMRCTQDFEAAGDPRLAHQCRELGVATSAAIAKLIKSRDEVAEAVTS